MNGKICSCRILQCIDFASSSFKQSLFKTPAALDWQGFRRASVFFKQSPVHNCRKKKLFSIAHAVRKKNFCSALRKSINLRIQQAFKES